MSTQEVKSSATGTGTNDALKELLQKVTANPAELKFPTDRWGFTAGIRREVLKAAASVRGQDDKHELLMQTLAILARHIQVRKPKDQENFAGMLARRKAAAEGRAIKETYAGSLEVPATRMQAETVSV